MFSSQSVNGEFSTIKWKHFCILKSFKTLNKRQNINSSLIPAQITDPKYLIRTQAAMLKHGTYGNPSQTTS